MTTVETIAFIYFTGTFLTGVIVQIRWIFNKIRGR